MEKVLAELAELVAYRQRYFDGTTARDAGPGGGPPPILALGLSSRKNLCVNPAVMGEWEAGGGPGWGGRGVPRSGRPACAPASRLPLPRHLLHPPPVPPTTLPGSRRTPSAED